ncbi:hypothetical protein ElyMa_001329700 [Elysia marginata]|uniref:Uncharacterized protein n=1 Tax=Elysia marginata TaxID=1093978 RepID=A0AAV4ILJ1_9GAST|nr:hypothetical protein ElyMa_001329700 [Elysia marginata]
MRIRLASVSRLSCSPNSLPICKVLQAHITNSSTACSCWGLFIQGYNDDDDDDDDNRVYALRPRSEERSPELRKSKMVNGLYGNRQRFACCITQASYGCY